MNKMKLTYGFLIALMIFSSCSGDDDNNDNGTDPSLIGTWTVTESKLNGNTVTSQQTVEFTSNRAKFIYSGGVTENGDYVKSGNTLTITWDEADPELETYVLDITELTDTTLKWETVISGEGTLKETLTK